MNKSTRNLLVIKHEQTWQQFITKVGLEDFFNSVVIDFTIDQIVVAIDDMRPDGSYESRVVSMEDVGSQIAVAIELKKNRQRCTCYSYSTL